MVILLLFSPLLLPVVHSQSHVTVTTQVTSIQVMTSTTGSSVVASLSPPQQLFNSAFTVNATAYSHSCAKFNLTFNSTQGQYVSGNFTSDIPLGIFITQDSSYRTWLASGGCASFPSSILSQPPTMTYAFNLALPNSGLWDIVLVNYSTTRNADGFMTAYLSYLGSTITEPLLSTVTQTNLVSSIMTVQATTGTTGIPGFQAESIIIGIILGLIALILLRRRHR
ncbi:MAG TPA: hypothetical protein VJZ32_13140 [Candidatus Bathyarchaeia archaeon]|nr:hypothetical protein [Candidatus Bathyarchaeia archaeon]